MPASAPELVLTGPVSARVKSSTDPDKWYAVTLEDRPECTCQGYSYRKDCRHVRALRDALGSSPTLLPESPAVLSPPAGETGQTDGTERVAEGPGTADRSRGVTAGSTSAEDGQKPADGALPELWTSRYQNQDAIYGSGMIPVGITRGSPRFKISYRDNLVYVREAAPGRDLMAVTDKLKFAEAYWLQVETTGFEFFAQRFREVSLRVGNGEGWPLVLLCFEDLTKPGEWCHRTMFGMYWEHYTGQKVREL